MTPATSRKISDIILGGAIMFMLIILAGMSGWIPKIGPSREMIPFGFVIVLIARLFRRRGAAVT